MANPAPTPAQPHQGPWWRELNRYHWFVLIVASLGWMFDTMDQQLFNLARVPAMRELLKPGEDVALYSGYSTAIFLIGWATGGLTFGVLGDRIGRAKTMMWTILIYSICTGLSALSVGFWDFAFYRFITGLGVGGEFAVGVSLVAEVMPNKARPHALGLLQALSAVGNVSAALISMGLGHLEESGAIGSAWRWMFVVGTSGVSQLIDANGFVHTRLAAMAAGPISGVLGRETRLTFYTRAGWLVPWCLLGVAAIGWLLLMIPASRRLFPWSNTIHQIRPNRK